MILRKSYSNNTATRIYISSGNNHQISNNTVGDIYLSTTTNTTVTNNTLSAGLYISSGSKQNTITQNTIPGQVYVDGVGSNIISNNTLNDRIYVATNSDNNLISQNTYNTTQANPITLSGGNISIPAPTLTTVTSSVGGPNSTVITVTGTAVAGSKIEFYSKIGNVYTFLFSAVEGSAADNNSTAGSFSFNVNTPNSNNVAFFILATNTDTLNNTSQFSNQLSFTPPVVPVTPTISLTSSKNPSLVGESINLTATLSDPLLTGNIEFFNGNTSLGSVVVTAGQAVLTTSTLPQGSNPIRAVYTLANSTTIQANLTQVVNAVVVVNDPAGNPIGGITIYPNNPATKPVSNPISKITTLPVSTAVTTTNNAVLGVSDNIVANTVVSQPMFDDTGATALIRTGGEANQIFKLLLMTSVIVLLGYLVVQSNRVQN